jgi:glycosyltransferase involved in cell wall biosynthesis
MTAVAFILVSYAIDTPAGIERATAALVAGLQRQGHEAVIFAVDQGGSPDAIPLESLKIRFPCDDSALRQAICHSGEDIVQEIDRLLTWHHIDVAVFADALWGLGRLPIRHPARRVLAMHIVGHDVDLAPAVAAADTVIAPSTVVLDQAAARGYSVDDWKVVPNALLHDEGVWLDRLRRQRLCRRGPLRVLSRPVAGKGVVELLRAAPELDRTVDIMLAAAPFEESTGSQIEIIERCRTAIAANRRIRLRTSGLPWKQVPGWLAEAAVVIVPSNAAETFGLVALEAMSVGTPVVAYDVGNLPDLIGSGGVIVPQGRGPGELWRAALMLTRDPVAYLRTSQAAYYRSRDFRPTCIADLFLKAVW